ncbi:MAG: PKD domain-containing protein [Thermoplasmatota archaeon]
MIRKKIQTIIIACFMLLATVAIVTNKTTATELRTVRGYVYVNGEITAPVQIKLIFDNQQKIATIPGDPVGYYAIDINVANGKTGAFHVTLAGGTWEAEETITIKSGVINYLNFNLTIDTSLPPLNNPPNTPSIPSGPSTGNPGTSYTYGTSATDLDEDQVYYQFDWGDGTTSDWIGPYDSGSTGSASHSWSSSGTYQVRARAKDVYGAESGWSSSRTVTISTTSGGGGTGGGGGGGFIPPNQNPVADAGGPYFAFPDENIVLNASASYAQDGKTITGYRWDFTGNDIWDTDWITTPFVNYSYTNPGEYTVKLEVKDSDDLTDTDTTTVTILAGNLPPTKPEVTGPTSGNKNILYEYTAVSTDPDNDTIQYIFEWGDEQTTTTEFYPSGTAVTVNHTWTSAGKYHMTITAFDNQTLSEPTHHIVYIDAEEVGDIGYLIDEDGDGVYDILYSYEIEDTTPVEEQDDGTYLLDVDGDGKWDYIYDPITKTLSEYIEDPEEQPLNVLLYGILILIILLLIFLILLAKRKKPKKPTSSKKPTPKQEKATSSKKSSTKSKKK